MTEIPGMIIRLSTKMATKIKKSPLQELHQEVGPLDEWYARIFSHKKAQYILTTNASTLYSVVMPGRGITSGKAYLDEFSSHLIQSLVSDGLQEFAEAIEKRFEDVFFSKANNRSIIGSTNEMVSHSKYMAYHRENMTPSQMAKMLNNTPYSFLKMRFPIKEMRRLNEELINS